MLKIYINNEEVIANQNFTIQKHMLNTPSVVLNNVCPKTWCSEKDYTTNFYHPLDYSKCKIIDETYHPYDPGTTTTINQSATLTDVDTTKEYELTQIEGNTTQASTPTPTSPQPINVVSGRQTITTCGKNLFKPFNFTKTNNGITFTYSEDGSINVNNTSTGKALSMYTAEATPYLIQLEAGTYVVSGNTNDIRLEVLNSSGTSLCITSTTNKFTLTETTSIFIRANIQSGKTFDNVKIYPQLEKGETPSQYEEYKGQTYEINLGKNLLKFDLATAKLYNTQGTWSDNVYSFYGIDATVNEDNTITIGSGTATAGYNFYLYRNETGKRLSLPAGTYTFSTNKTPASGNGNFVIKFKDNNGNTISGVSDIWWSGDTSKSATKTINQDFQVAVYIQISSGATETEKTYQIQIEKESKATSYSPYKTPIELCKIGDYKDRIYKSNGTWYIEKNIDKLTLDGTETWRSTSMTASTSYMYFYTTDYDNLLTWNLYGAYCNYLEKYDGSGGENPYITRGITIDKSVFSTCASSSTDTAKMRVAFDKSIESNTTNFKTWLSNNKPIIYYQLATPTTTEITDTELISCLRKPLADD